MFRKRKEAISFPSSCYSMGNYWPNYFLRICLYMFIRLSTDLIEKKPFLFDQSVINTVQILFFTSNGWIHAVYDTYGIRVYAWPSSRH